MLENVNRFIESFVVGKVSAFGSESAPMVTLIMGAMLSLELPFDFRTLTKGSAITGDIRPFYVVYRVGMADTDGWEWDEYTPVTHNNNPILVVRAGGTQ